MIISIGTIALILTMVLFIQFKTVRETDITAIETMREAELRTELASWKSKYDEISTKLQDTEEKISNYRNDIENNEKSSQLLEQELIETEKYLGYTDLEGEGISVKLDDTEYKQVESSDILSLVNELRLAGAEAISINDKRLIYKSYISYINEGNFITVNGNRIVEPYVVKAIGNTTHLESSVSQKKYGYIDTKVSAGKNVTLEKSNEIIIYAYDGELDFDYVKEEE